MNNLKINKLKLKAKLLRAVCDPNQFSFESTEEIPELSKFVGQERAINAAKFGIGIKREGFNVFALGPSGVGKRSIIKPLLKARASQRKPASDICYVHNFTNPRRPKVLILQAGTGKKLVEDMSQLVEILRSAIPGIFEDKSYQAKIKEIQESIKKKQDESFTKLEQEAQKNNFTIIQTETGFMLAATKDGKILTEDDFAKLSKDEREKQEKTMDKLHQLLTNFLEQIPLWLREQREKIKETLKKFTMIQVGGITSDVQKKYKNEPQIFDYLNDVQKAILENPSEFRQTQGKFSPLGLTVESPQFTRYRVNLFVDNSDLDKAPIVYEDNPIFINLVGCIDHISNFGALVTDFTLIRAGALHKANGGYLLLDALKLLQQPFSWEALKRALRAKEIRVENVNQWLGYMGTVTLEPEPVPLDIKIILLGERYIYYLLCALDPDFLQLFKIAADFDEDIKSNNKNNFLFAQLLKSLSKKEKLMPLSKNAVVRVIEYAKRKAEDTQKISTHAQSLTDLLREADHYAQEENKTIIDKVQIEKAIKERKIRASRVQEKQLENISRGLLLIDTSNKIIGQINGLSYVSLGGFAFGSPVRITARVAPGKGDLIDIEREVKLGGPIHSKGILILKGYLNGNFVLDKPLSLYASLVFEQSYGKVEGDSASMAEACALLSALAKVPIKQSIAITGSINQLGVAQAIGGVNEKIEGFFDICKERGLSGQEGVIIPKSNVDRLMLKEDLVKEVSKGNFNIYAVETIDEALEILTGIKAGIRNKAGNFPKNSLFGKVETQLKNFNKEIKKLRK